MSTDGGVEYQKTPTCAGAFRFQTQILTEPSKRTSTNPNPSKESDSLTLQGVRFKTRTPRTKESDSL